LCVRIENELHLRAANAHDVAIDQQSALDLLPTDPYASGAAEVDDHEAPRRRFDPRMLT
jgi:hypothetical protein